VYNRKHFFSNLLSSNYSIIVDIIKELVHKIIRDKKLW